MLCVTRVRKRRKEETKGGDSKGAGAWDRIFVPCHSPAATAGCSTHRASSSQGSWRKPGSWVGLGTAWMEDAASILAHLGGATSPSAGVGDPVGDPPATTSHSSSLRKGLFGRQATLDIHITTWRCSMPRRLSSAKKTKADISGQGRAPGSCVLWIKRRGLSFSHSWPLAPPTVGMCLGMLEPFCGHEA